jgi:hypothetical protein
MMQRECVCGKPIAVNSRLCSDCKALYGEVLDWPDWLVGWMSDYQRELSQQFLHQDLAIFDDETFTAREKQLRQQSDSSIGVEPEFDEWGNEIEIIDGFPYVDQDKVIAEEKEFDSYLKYLSELSPKEKARLRKKWGMD